MTRLHSFICHTSKDDSIIQTALQVAVVRVVDEVSCVQAKEKGWKDCPVELLCCRRPYQTHSHGASKTEVCQSESQWSLQSSPTAAVKEGSVQQIDDGVIQSSYGSVSKLQRVKHWVRHWPERGAGWVSPTHSSGETSGPQACSGWVPWDVQSLKQEVFHSTGTLSNFRGKW